jgi:hypothetical protein
MQTYGLEIFNTSEYESYMYLWSKPGGCSDQVGACQKNATEQDPNWQGDIPSVIECFKKMDACEKMADMIEHMNVRFRS